MRVVRTLAAVVFFAVLAGCSSAEVAATASGLDPQHTRTVHGHGFVVQDDSLEPHEEAALFEELAQARPKILALLKGNAAPGDFRTWEERREAACAPIVNAEAGEIHVVVQKRGGRCHADESGLTILKAHVARRDATHELVHYLAGGGWRPIDEGLAVFVTEKLWGPAWGVSLDLRARVYRDLNLDDGLARDRLRPDMNRRDYDLAGSFVKFLVDGWGWDKFLELYRGAPGDYHTVYGLSEQELLARWQEKVRGLDVRQSSAYYRFKDYLVNLRSG